MIDTLRDKPLGGLREVLYLSAPATVSLLSRTVTQFVDGVMVSRVGAPELGAQGVGMLMAFLPESFTIGVLGMVNTFASQSLGAGRSRQCGQYTWAGMLLGLLFIAVIMPLAIFAKPIFAAIGHEPQLQALEVMYFRYMILCVPVTISARVLESFFYGVHRPNIIFIAAVISNAANIFVNWLLIYGKWGAPRMGLEGAAIATVASFVLQFLILSAAFLLTKHYRQYGTLQPRAMRLRQCADILRVGWPAGVAFWIDIATWTLFTTYMVGRFGTDHLAAANAAMRYMQISFLPAVGISIATTTLVGRYIGRGQPDIARRRAHTGLRVAMTYMACCAVTFLVFRHELISLFVRSAPRSAEEAIQLQNVVRYGGRIMICAAIFQVFDGMGIVYNGALRGAGDTLWPMLISATLAIGLLGTGGCLITWYWPELTSLGPYCVATFYIIVLGSSMAWRFEGGAWRKISLLGPPGTPMSPQVEGAPVTPGEMADQMGSQ